MHTRREYTLAVLGLACGGALAVVVAQAEWVVATSRDAGYDTAFRGSDVAPGLVACALVALAGSVGVLGTRGLGRRIVGGVLAVVGVVVIATALRVVLDAAVAVRHSLSVVTGSRSVTPDIVSLSWWWCLLAALGGFAVLVAGILTGLHGGRWPVMAGRYDAPSDARRGAAVDPWALLDRGEDPTVDPGTAMADPDLQQ
jgi:uncharacterized membrane protein (TIGR02234 family)